jgi:hypothetical protein
MRRYRTSWSGAEAVLFLAWAALATGLLGHALAHDSIGAGLLGAFAAWQMCHVWVGVHRAR